MKRFYMVAIFSFLAIAGVSAQGKTDNYTTKDWKEVATGMTDEWYGTAEAKVVAENVLLAQREIGGWEKNQSYHKNFSDSERAHFIKSKSEPGATFDNGATITELRFLAKVYRQLKDERYKQAFETGIRYILESQYENGGWPQFYPVRKGSTSYSAHITYNDNSMVNILRFLKEVFTGGKEFTALQLSSGLIAEAHKAYWKGIECILRTQIRVNGKPAVWCAQHDENTLAPANARSYELASFSGSESAGIVLLLMEIENPSDEIISSVNGAVQWFSEHKIEGIKLETEIQPDGKRNRIVVEAENAPPLWGRFYDLETGKPFFCSRDGVKKHSLAEISYERRNGYSWYTGSPLKVLEMYPEWKSKLSKTTK